MGRATRCNQALPSTLSRASISVSVLGAPSKSTFQGAKQQLDDLGFNQIVPKFRGRSQSSTSMHSLELEQDETPTEKYRKAKEESPQKRNSAPAKMKTFGLGDLLEEED